MSSTPSHSAIDLTDEATIVGLLNELNQRHGEATALKIAARRQIENSEAELRRLHDSTPWNGKKTDYFASRVVNEEATRATAQEAFTVANSQVAAIELDIANLRAARNAALLNAVDPEDARRYMDAQRGRYVGTWER
jgi:hypothetical protein